MAADRRTFLASAALTAAASRLSAAQAQYQSAVAQLAISRANYAAVVGQNPGDLAPEPSLQYLLPANVDEAFTVADRVALMSPGRIQQVATPAELLDRPASRFVAEFLGIHNLLAAVLTASGDGLMATTVLGPVRLAQAGLEGLAWLPGAVL